MNSAQALDLAMKQHQAGNLRAAEQLYRQILQAEPHHADALHLLGVIAHQVGRNDLAIEHIRTAVRARPNFPAAHCNLGTALQALGQLQEAVICFREAIRLQPDFPQAHYNLGNALKDQGKHEEAIASYQQALRLKPDAAEVHNNLGMALQVQGNYSAAVASFRQALHLKPDFAEVYSNLGFAWQSQGKFEEAIASYRQALRLKPDFAEAFNNLGNALKNQGNLDEAIAHYRQALRLNPKNAEALGNLGNALIDQGHFEEAITYFQQALHLKPDHAEGHNNLGVALQNQGKLEEAIACFQQALRLKPDYAEACSNLGNVLLEQRKFGEAIACYQQAIRLKPDFAWAYSNLGNALYDQGNFEEAIGNYRQALRLKPDYAEAHSNVVFGLPFNPAYDSIAIYQEARRWHDQHAQPLAQFIQPHANHPDPDRRLRIGYVSPDFRDHCQSFFTIPLLSNHDHSQVEIYCYADVKRPDDVTLRLRGHADVWRSIVGISHQQVAELIRSDRIDILVDLTMHMAKNRLLVFARKPAPVQVAWLAYPGTTGLAAMDYRLTDPFLDPPGEHDDWYSEQSIRLPDTFWCYDPRTDEPPVNELPALANGFVTFGCLNNFCKVNDSVLTLWAKVLAVSRNAKQSRLLMLAPKGQARDHVLAILKQQGIDEQRVEFVDWQPRQQYLQLYNQIDLGLDLLPYNGHTTSLDAFWMGVPTVTQIGKTVVGRAGWCQLCNLGLPELAARTPDEFVKIAVQLAGDLPRLQELRASLRERLRASPLMDGKRFAHNLEQAFRQMWRTWCQKKG